MKFDTKKDFPVFIMILIFLYFLPHIIFCWSFSFDSLYALIVFSMISVACALSALTHVLLNGRFSSALTISVALAMLTYYFRIEWQHALILSCSFLIFLGIELFAFPEDDEQEIQNKFPTWIYDIARNKKYLALLVFWTIGFIGVIQISTATLPLWVVFMPTPCIFMILPLAVLPVFRDRDVRLGIGGWIVIVVVMFVTFVLSGIFYLSHNWMYSFLADIVAFCLMLTMEGFVSLVHIAMRKISNHIFNDDNDP